MLFRHSHAQKHQALLKVLRDRKFKIAVSLSSGGAEAMGRDLALMEVITELGIPWHEIHGTSAGASVASAYARWKVIPDNVASGQSKEEVKTISEVREGFVRTTNYRNVFEPSAKALGRLAKERSLASLSALFSGNRLENHIMVNLTSATFSDVKPDVYIYAERERELDYEVFSRYTHPQLTLHEAVRASLAIPYFFEPKEISGISYVDGGMLVNTPLWNIIANHRKKSRRHPLLILACTGLYPYKQTQFAGNFWELIKFRYYQKILIRNFYRELELALGESNVYLWLFYPKIKPIKSFAFHRLDEYAKANKADFYEHYFDFLDALELPKFRRKMRIQYPYVIPSFEETKDRMS